MSRMRILSRIRRQHYYRPILRALAEFGVDDYAIDPPTGRGHAILRFDTDDGTHRVPLPGSPSGGSNAAHYLRREIRRRVFGASV